MALPNLDELAAQERKEYFRKWREANKDKVSQHNRDYWRRRVEKKLAEQQSITQDQQQEEHTHDQHQ